MVAGANVDSAGFIGPGRSSPERAQEAARQRRLDLSLHVSKVVTGEIARPHDLIVVMEPRQRGALRRHVGATAPVVNLGDLDPEPAEMRAILDPWGKDLEVFQSSFARIDRCLAELAKFAVPLPPEPKPTSTTGARIGAHVSTSGSAASSGDQATAGPLRILHTLAPAHVGGIEQVVRDLAVGHSGLGHAVHVAVSVPDLAHPYVGVLRDAGVDVHPIVASGRAYRRERREFGAVCSAIRPDVVHSHGYRSDVLHAGVARQCGIPLVSTVHGFTGGDWKNRLFERVQVRWLRRFDAVVAVSTPLGEDLVARGVPRAHLSIIRNALQAPSDTLSRREACTALALPTAGFNVGWVGRLSPEKGVDVFLDAIDRLDDVPLQAVVLGDGPEQGAMEARVRAGPLRDRVRFCGVVENARRLFTAFDAFVLSSRTEGTPMVLLEAMATGVPIVATRVGGVPDVVSPEEALLVPSGDAGAIAEAVRAIRSDDRSARRRAGAARRRLESAFSVQAWLGEYEDLYRRLVASAG